MKHPELHSETLMFSLRWMTLIALIALMISVVIVGVSAFSRLEYDAIVDSLGRIPLERVDNNEYEINGCPLRYDIDGLNIPYWDDADKTKYLRRSFMDKVRFLFRAILGIPISFGFGIGLALWLQRIPVQYKRTKRILCSNVSLCVFLVIGGWLMMTFFIFL